MNAEEKIAKWLYDKIITEEWVSQRDAVQEIEDEFGGQYIYTNENGNPAISRSVLKEFGKLKGNRITWDRSALEWHVKTDIDRELEDLEVELPEIDTPKFDIAMPAFDPDILKDLDTKNNK